MRSPSYVLHGTGNPHSPTSFGNERRWEEVAVFLRLVDSTLGCLIDRFVSAGVDSEHRMIVMSKWPATELDNFLRCDVRLDAFECKLIRDGLRKYYS